MMNKKTLSIIGVSCLGAVLFAGSMFGGNTAEAGLNDYGKVSEYSKMLADSYQSVNDYYIETLSVDGLSDNQKKEYLTRDDVYAVGNNIVISKEEVQQYTDFYLHDGESEADAHQLAVKDAMERNALYVAAIQNGFSVTDEEIARIISRWTGIPVAKLTEGEKTKILGLEDVLHTREIGQDEAVTKVPEALIRS